MKTREYYEAVAERLVPFLTGRKLAVEQRFREGEKPVYRRHEGTGAERRWISIREPADVVRWAKQRAVAFHGHLKPEGPGAWFFLDIDSRELSLEMGRVGALHALDVIEGAGLKALVKFSGSDGFHLMWEMPDLRALGKKELWDFEREVVQAIADRVEERLEGDPRAEEIRAAVGPGSRLISTNSQLEDRVERTGGNEAMAQTTWLEFIQRRLINPAIVPGLPRFVNLLNTTGGAGSAPPVNPSVSEC